VEKRRDGGRWGEVRWRWRYSCYIGYKEEWIEIKIREVRRKDEDFISII
jgi:hypothetical protein